MPGGRSVRIEAFEYPAGGTPSPMLWEDIREVGEMGPLDRASDAGDEDAGDTRSPESIRSSAAEEAARSFEAGREQGIREALETAASEQHSLLQDADKARREQAASLAQEVKTDRERFLNEAESELVHLALAIAARILRREAQMDPLFLIGAVRVALGQLAATIQVRLRVPAGESELWAQTLAHIPNLRVKPAVIPEDSMQLGDCLIETEMGTVDLGMRAQLHQIERALLNADSTTKADKPADTGSEEQEVEA